MATKTIEEIQALKDDWLKDPCWDIEDTEGFEEHKDELLAYHKQVDAEWEEKARKRADARARMMKEETGITDPATAQTLYTFSEIELALERSDREMELDQAQVQLVRATLLLAAQMKRIADVLEANDGDNGLLVSTIGRYE